MAKLDDYTTSVLKTVHNVLFNEISQIGNLLSEHGLVYGYLDVCERSRRWSIPRCSLSPITRRRVRYGSKSDTRVVFCPAWKWTGPLMNIPINTPFRESITAGGT